MARAITIAVTVAAAGLFAWGVPLVQLFDALSPLITALSIMVAAVFVRLNRGMPALEWTSLDPDDRRGLTSAIVRVTIDYARIIAIIAVVLAALVTLSVIGRADAGGWPDWARRVASGLVGGLVVLCAARMAYVVWRDIDIVGLQKRLIDGTASRDTAEQQAKLADDIVARMRAANVRSIGGEPPKPWVD